MGDYISWMCTAGFIWLLLQTEFWSYGCFVSKHTHHFLSSLCCAYKVFVVYSEKGRRSKERAMIVIFMPEDISPTPAHSFISYLKLFCTKNWVMYTLLLTGFTKFKNFQKLLILRNIGHFETNYGCFQIVDHLFSWCCTFILVNWFFLPFIFQTRKNRKKARKQYS